MIFGNKIGSNMDLSRECSNSPIEEEVDLKESFGYKPEGRRASRMGFKVPNQNSSSSFSDLVTSVEDSTENLQQVPYTNFMFGTQSNEKM